MKEQIQVYKITSPSNFPADPHIKHGTSKLFKSIPDWAKNNPRVVVEKIWIISDVETVGKEEFKCEVCGKVFKTARGLRAHVSRVHK